MQRKRKKPRKRVISSLNMSNLVSQLRTDFEGVKDSRAKNVVYKLQDVLLSGFVKFFEVFWANTVFSTEIIASGQSLFNTLKLSGVIRIILVQKLL